MAGWTRLELATFCVTGRRSNQLSYHPVNRERGRNVDSEEGVSSVLLCPPELLATEDGISLRDAFLKEFAGVFPIHRDLGAQFIHAAELAFRSQEMEPVHRDFVAIGERRFVE